MKKNLLILMLGVFFAIPVWMTLEITLIRN